MSFKSGSKCSINNLGFSEAADTVFATQLPIRGKLFPIIKVADIRYTAEIRALYPNACEKCYDKALLFWKGNSSRNKLLPLLSQLHGRNL